MFSHCLLFMMNFYIKVCIVRFNVCTLGEKKVCSLRHHFTTSYSKNEEKQSYVVQNWGHNSRDSLYQKVFLHIETLKL